MFVKASICVRREHRFYIKQSLSDAIFEAALCRLQRGKHHPHQRRLPVGVLQDAEARLQKHAHI